MKKVMIALAVVAVIIVGGVFFVFSNLDAIVETAIETAGTSAVGSRVEVGSVELDLLGGTASIYDFSVANPAGFSNADMVSFAELSVSLDVQDISGDQIHIYSIVARSPHVLYESREGTSNVDTVSARFEGDEPARAEQESDGAQPVIRIDSILIEDIGGTLQSDLLPSEVEVNLGDISLTALEGTPQDLANEIMAPLMSQIATSAGQALVQATREILGNVADEAQEQLDEASSQLQDAADDALDKVGNLFKRD